MLSLIGWLDCLIVSCLHSTQSREQSWAESSPLMVSVRPGHPLLTPRAKVIDQCLHSSLRLVKTWDVKRVSCEGIGYSREIHHSLFNMFMNIALLIYVALILFFFNEYVWIYVIIIYIIYSRCCLQAKTFHKVDNYYFIII